MKFEEYLQKEHTREYVGSKDLALEDYENWICNLEPEDWIYYANYFGTKKYIDGLDKAQEIITQCGRE